MGCVGGIERPEWAMASPRVPLQVEAAGMGGQRGKAVIPAFPRYFGPVGVHPERPGRGQGQEDRRGHAEDRVPFHLDVTKMSVQQLWIIIQGYTMKGRIEALILTLLAAHIHRLLQ